MDGGGIRARGAEGVVAASKKNRGQEDSVGEVKQLRCGFCFEMKFG